MKKLLFILLALSVLIISGCVTSPAESEEPSEGIVSEETSDQQQEKTAVKRMIKIPYILKETDYFSDGYIESYKVYAYNEDMSPAREDLFDSFDEIIESVVYEKTSESSVKETRFNARGQLQSWKQVVSGDDGRVVKIEAYNAEDLLQTVSEYEYNDAGNKILWRVSDGEGIVLSETRYVYSNGMNTVIEIYDSSLKMREYFKNEYENGLLIRNTHYGENDEVLAIVEYLYSGNNLVAEKYLRANGSTSRTVEYTNDDEGSAVKIENFNGNGDLKDWSENEYEYVSEEITVWE